MYIFVRQWQVVISKSFQLPKMGNRRGSFDNQYMLGTDVLVAPVLHEGNTREVTFPKGGWTGKSFEGGTAKKVETPPGRMPVYLRAGTTLHAFTSK